METLLIECKNIDVPKVSGDVRTFSKEFAIKLADSLKIDGQQNPIIVRPNPAVPGRYILIAGKHRLYGMKNVLKEQFIRATVIVDMDDAEAAIAADVENLWRNPLNKAQHAAAVKRWHTHWLAKMPAIEPTATKAATAGQTDQAVLQATSDFAGAADVQAGETLAVGYTATTEAASDEPVADRSETAFNETVAAVTGQSEAVVRRSKAIAKAFTAEQLEVFVQMEVNQTDMMTIAKIKDEGQRAEVVNLIASGMVVEDAIKEVMKEKAPARYNNGGKEADAAKAAAKQEKAPELSDDEWFEANCGEKAAMLGDPARFKSDALLFRAVSELRHTFRVKGKKFLAATKKAGNYGALWNLINRFVSISHPKDWLICPECCGKGVVPLPAQGEPDHTTKCPKCFGGGYLLKTEEYL